MKRWRSLLLVVGAGLGCTSSPPPPAAPPAPGFGAYAPAVAAAWRPTPAPGAPLISSYPAAGPRTSGAALEASGGQSPAAAPPNGTPRPADPASPHGATDDPDEDDEIDDGFEASPAAPVAPLPGESAPPSPIAGLSDREIEARLRRDPTSLGPISVGSTNAGALVAGVPMPKGERWVIIDPAHAWGTRETVDYLARGIDKVHEQFPGAPKLYIGHISSKNGGYLSPHVSHQAGRDVDISYYLLNGRAGFVRATAENLDMPKTWAFVRALITETDVEMILIDTSVQRLLSDYASKIGEDPAWLDSIFQSRGKAARPMIRHAKGHGNHIHIRFYNPIAQEIGRRAHALLAKVGHVKTTTSYLLHKARSGDTLGSLARRYGTSVDAIQRVNGLKTNAIKAKHVYKIPKHGHVIVRPPMPSPVVIPPRRLPPVLKSM
jgi:penicillin-insensitive murein endopeptidase